MYVGGESETPEGGGASAGAGNEEAGGCSEGGGASAGAGSEGAGGGSEGGGGQLVLVAVEQSPASEKKRKTQLSLSSCFKRQGSWGSGGEASTALVAVSPSKPQMPVPSSQIVLSRRRGRPKKAAGAPKGKYTSLSGQQRAWICREVPELMQDGFSLHGAYNKIVQELGCDIQTVRDIHRDSEYWLAWAKEQDRKPSKRAGTNRRQGEHIPQTEKKSSSKGCRKVGKRGYLGKNQPLRWLVLETVGWAKAEFEAGHELYRQDFIAHYQRHASSQAAFWEEEETAGTLTPENSELLKHLNERLGELKKARFLRSFGQYLMTQSGFVNRAKQRVTAMSEYQEIQAVKLGWKLWDAALHKIGCAPAEELKDYVFNPHRLASMRERTVILASDQVPVWLKADSTKKAVPVNTTTAARLAKRARTSRKKVAGGSPQKPEAELQPRTQVVAAGSSANSRSRFTLVARQLIEHYFDNSRDPEGFFSRNSNKSVGVINVYNYIDNESYRYEHTLISLITYIIN